MGTVLYPEAFADVDIAAAAARFYRFFVGMPLYPHMAELFGPFGPLEPADAEDPAS